MLVQKYKNIGKAIFLISVLLLVMPVGTALAGEGCEISTVSVNYTESSSQPQNLGWAKIKEIEACDYVQVEISLPEGVEWETPMNVSNIGDYIYIKDGSTVIDDGIYVNADESSYIVRFDNPIMFEDGVELRAVFNNIIVSHSAPDKIGLYIRVTGVENDLIVWQVKAGSNIDTDEESNDDKTDHKNPVLIESSMSIGSLTMHINGEPYTMDVAPYIKEDRTYLPLRFVCYAMGMNESNLVWDQEQKIVRIQKENTVIELQIGSNIIRVNGKAQQMDVAPEIRNDRTMLPIRFIAEAFGADVSWDKAGKTVSITI
jgi:hypothetical protein